MSTVTIGLDCRLSGVKHAGLGRYIKSLALRLPLALPTNYRLVYFFADKTQWSELLSDLHTLQLPKNLKAQEILGRIKIVISPIRHYTFAEQSQMPKIFAQENLDLLHVPHFNLPLWAREKKVVLTIHDLLWHETRGMNMTTLKFWQYHLKYLVYLLVVRRAVRKSQAIIVPSEVTKSTLLKHYPQAATKTQVIYNGASNMTHFHARCSEKKLPNNFMLYVGSLYPHKNLTLILKVLNQQPHLHLVIVSTRDAFWEKLKTEIAQMEVSGQVTFLGKVSDEVLKYLYQHAQVLVQPSISEGFGLTGIEAMGLGTKVVASDIPIFKEIYGNSYFAFDPSSPASFIQALSNASKQPLAQYQSQAQKQAGKYNWNTMTKQVVTLYQQVLGDEKN